MWRARPLPEYEENVLLVQLFVVVTACTGLALSTGLDERAALARKVRLTSREMTDQARRTVRFLFDSFSADYARLPAEHAERARAAAPRDG